MIAELGQLAPGMDLCTGVAFDPAAKWLAITDASGFLHLYSLDPTITQRDEAEDEPAANGDSKLATKSPLNCVADSLKLEEQKIVSVYSVFAPCFVRGLLFVGSEVGHVVCYDTA